ncbi:MAG TPA: FAD-dependent oxidoreductase [Syntrophales bacterium]|nr:FAD-dependent oxidoreductase [Syntrophales bacterium]HPN10014.1 FAD-dependent oxidoreductase [Syntrophales bacterium]HPX81360.1 FAD-dependent oxidoreductase [Syntrophales bacterium]HQK79101.1 FAD-dependent oxidoreductase [Syntrophales bacterium]
MNKVAFSSWNGKIIDNRTPAKGKGKAQEPAAGAFPAALEGYSYDALMGWNGLVVFDPKADVLALTLAYIAEARKLSCGECSVCMIGIDRVREILLGMSAGKGAAKDLAEIEEIVKGVMANSKCNFGRATALTPVLDAVKYFKSAFLEAGKGEKKAAGEYRSAVTAPCMEACPATLDIPGYIELIRNNKFKESLDLIRERCILPGVIGRACTHPCEAACVRKDMDGPLAIRLLKRAAADAELRGGSALPAPREEKKEKIAIIGAGPAGLAAAYNLRLMGYGVTIFEALPKAGGMASVGIPDYRLPKDILNHEIDLIKRMGVDIRFNSKVEALNMADFQKQGYAAVFTAIGAHVGAKIGCKGEEIVSEDVVQGAEFLRGLSLGKKVVPVNKVAIIGGGNVALDCARNCVRLGFKNVEIVYRRSRAEMPGSKEEIEEALHEGVKITYLTAPIGIVRKAGKVTAIECVKMKLGDPDESGRKRPIPIKGSEFILKTDMVIAATGQKPDLGLLPAKEKGSLTTAWGTIKADPASSSTEATRIFAGGDCVTGPATLIEALNAGNKAAKSIAAYLQGETFVDELSFEGIDVSQQREMGFIPPAPAGEVGLLDAAERIKSFAEVEGGFDADAAMKEAQRCLRCYRLMVWQ